MQRIKLITKIGGKALPRLGGNGKILGGIPHVRHHHDDGLDTDGAGKPAKISEGSTYCGMSLTTNLVQKSQRQNSVTVNAVYCHRRGCKSIPPTTENWLRKLFTYSKKNYMSTDDKHETNHINNKYNDTNMNTRKMHTLEHALRSRSLRHTLMSGHMHHLAQVLSPVMSSMYMCVSL